LFLPDGEAETVPVDSPLVIVVEGPLCAYAKVYLPNLQHTIMLYNTPGSLPTSLLTSLPTTTSGQRPDVSAARSCQSRVPIMK
jgi:hypothetical protein